MWWKRKASEASVHAAAPGPAVDLYRAISVMGAAACCPSASAIMGRRMLESRAPKLPLPGCTMPLACRCRFQKHADRRDADGGRRLDDMVHLRAAERAAWYAGPESRKSRGRRKED
jgi:hypothetical protein